jgi:nucleoside-diphosphate-sugar epimerase
MRIFLTGGSGFVGQSLIKKLLEKKNEVFALGRSERSRKIILSLGANPIQGNLKSIESYKSYLEGMDAVVHVAAMIEMWGKYDDFYQINVRATEDLLIAADEMGVNKFIYISAAAVVSDGKPLVDINENYKPTNEPIDNYSKTKALAEQFIVNHKGSIKKIILRPPFIWGKNMKMFIESRKNIERMGIPTIGKIDHTLATCHVRNLNAAIILSLESDKEGTYFVTDGEKRELRFFLKKLAKSYGLDTGEKNVNRKLALVSANFLEFFWNAFKLKGNPPLTKSMVYLMGSEFSIDDSKARNELGYKNVLTIDEGLKLLVKKNDSP